ncbi:DUF6622 family protein [Marinomonas sp. TI.3.20]|uniref:DUF6622 family protein n=1 Tax=Marinomonas sp. TI.3.20 TaxID=3121296 RepID=UPI00312003B8
MLEILRHTPLWVYFIFTMILYLGISSCFKQRLKSKSIFHLSGAFLVLSIYNLLMKNDLFLIGILSWSGGLAIATGVAYYFILKKKYQFSLEGEYLVIPGSPSILLVSLFFFAVKFWFGYTVAIKPELSSIPIYVILDKLCSGLVVGFFSGRSIALYLIGKCLFIEKRDVKNDVR